MTTDRVILLVEDNEDDVFVMRRAIKGAGLTNPIRVVTHGQEAIDYLSGEGAFANRSTHPLPAVVFLDLKLPGVSGHEVLAWMRREAQFRSTPVVVLTASERPADLKKSYELGANSFLVKPPTSMQLMEICGGYFFGRREAGKSNDAPASKKRA